MTTPNTSSARMDTYVRPFLNPRKLLVVLTYIEETTPEVRCDSVKLPSVLDYTSSLTINRQNSKRVYLSPFSLV